MSIVIHDDPRTTGEPVEGITAGRMVAYWPTAAEEADGIRGYGRGGYIPAVIVADWIQTNPETGEAVAVTIPCCNIRLFHNGDTERLRNSEWKTSVRYSCAPARGCFTWIPKA